MSFEHTEDTRILERGLLEEYIMASKSNTQSIARVTNLFLKYREAIHAAALAEMSKPQGPDTCKAVPPHPVWALACAECRFPADGHAHGGSPHPAKKCSICESLRQVEEALDRLRNLECGKCGRSLAPDGDCHGCRADKVEPEREALVSKLQTMAKKWYEQEEAHEDESAEPFLSGYVCAGELESALKEAKHG